MKLTKLTERFSLRYSFDVYNLTNTPSFDIPIDNVTQNLIFSNFPQQGPTPAVPGPTVHVPLQNNTAGPLTTGNFFNCPGGLGQTTKTIGSSRQVQMSLGLTF